MTYSYKCLREGCDNFKGFTIQLPIKDAPLLHCPICKGKIVQEFNSVNVNLSFSGSFNSTRK